MATERYREEREKKGKQEGGGMERHRKGGLQSDIDCDNYYDYNYYHNYVLSVWKCTFFISTFFVLTALSCSDDWEDLFSPPKSGRTSPCTMGAGAYE